MAGGSNIKWYGLQVLMESEEACARGLDILANDIVKAAQESMRESKSGKDYRPKWRQEGRKSKPKGAARGRARNVSSAPGEAPAVQYGDLIRSIAWIRIEKLTRRIGTNQKYGRYLEFGTKRMKPRPFLRPALKSIVGANGEKIFDRLMK